MSKLRIKVSGCMRSMTGAQIFCALRTYLATAARHGISALDALTRAAEGDPWIPEIPALTLQQTSLPSAGHTTHSRHHSRQRTY